MSDESGEITEEQRQEILAEVTWAEAQFDAKPDSAEACLAMHEARVRAGWHEFVATTNSPTKAKDYLPWVAKKRVAYVETWGGSGDGPKIPTPAWLAGGQVGSRVIQPATISDDGQWRRKVEDELDVVAIESFGHLRSLATRIGFGLMVMPEDSRGLQELMVKDDRDY